ncbi:MAG: hypothetical protein KC431_21040, partial [Myxococcales bacterium]|nr:hypothetical protein [Myxococcales bacterium]
EAAARARLQRLRTQARELGELIDGTLDPDIDPTPLLRLDLADVDELVGDERRLRSALGLEAAGPEAETSEQPEESGGDEQTQTSDTEERDEEPGPWVPDEALAADLKVATAALDGQRLRLLALSPAQRKQLLTDHAARKTAAKQAQEDAAADLLAAEAQLNQAAQSQISEAEDAAAKAAQARQKALQAAAQARTEAIRRLAEEQARLLGVQESHALLRASLTRRKQEVRDAAEVALGWEREVGRVAAEIPSAERQAEADALYEQVRDALGDARGRLRDTLDAVGHSAVEPVGEPLTGLPEDIDQSEITALRNELEASTAELRTLESEVVWSAAKSGRDDIVRLNRARLSLLEVGSAELRHRITGFGKDGVEQVRREFDQIGLELRFRVKSLPGLGQTLMDELEASPVQAFFAFLQLGFLLLVFRTWRRRAEALLSKARDGFRTRKQGNARVNAAFAGGLWYLGRIRKPLEWLLLFAAIYSLVFGGGEDVLEIEVLWLTSLWVLVGSTVILLVDAIAARD